MYKKVPIKKIFRNLSQAIFIFFFILLFKKTVFPLNDKFPVSIFFRINIFDMIITTLATLHFDINFLPSLILIVLLLILGNFYCFWVCPLGGLIDYFNLITVRKLWKSCGKFWGKLNFYFKNIKILILSLAIFSILFYLPFTFWIFDPYVIMMKSFITKGFLIYLLFVIFLSVLAPRFWCNCVCPFGFINYIIGVKLRNKIKRRFKIEKKRIP